ncbi:MAG: tRNA (adenosine(37)-N6)-threonylcarbamoyltransferase complex ATPase subunit type 1 TsaE [Pseudomonadota bacterium]
MLEKSTHSEKQTTQLAMDIALALKPGDLVLLGGDLGAGKTALARGIIQALAEDSTLEVPSPTYTLSHQYDTQPPINHFDLYRLSGMDELDALGWEDTLENGCVLMEWPERCFEILPERAVSVMVEIGSGDSRTFSFSGNAQLLDRLERSFLIREFLDNAGQKNASRTFLLGDASTRSYEMVNGGAMLLMNAPRMPDGPAIRDGKPYSQIAHLAEDVSAFVAVDQLLLDLGVRAPNIHESAIEDGLLLTEYLGGKGILDDQDKPDPDRYMASIELLAHLHNQTIPETVEYLPGKIHQMPHYDDEAKRIEIDLLQDWYIRHEAGQLVDRARFYEVWQSLFDRVNKAPQTLVLRDYHSPNILWLEQETGIMRVGVIDFQDAVIGPQSYDVASLSQDARVDVPEQLELKLVDHYIGCRLRQDTSFDQQAFREEYAIMAAQRATKILGIFVRLDVRDGKPQYRRHLPRIRQYLKRSLRHPVLSEYREWLETVIEL